MDRVLEEIVLRQRELEEIMEKKKEALRSAPPGVLRVSLNKGRIQYYQRTQPKDFCGKYIRKKERALAVALARKEYDQKVLQYAKEEWDQLKMIERFYNGQRPEEAYEEILSVKRELILPDVLSSRRFAEQWEKEPFTGKPFREDAPLIFTGKGQRMRSKSEILIANALEAHGNIPYRYECPLVLPDGGVFHPDFTVLNVRLKKVYYWEHFGMMDDEEYCRKAVDKLSRYQRNGFFPGDSLILTFETARQPLDPRSLEDVIEQYLV